MNYIALLRGINVGGNNKISMSELKEAFVEHGFTNVSTYINSGNVLFSSGMADEEMLKNQCEALIKSRFGQDIAVAVISGADLIDAMDHAPEWWGKGNDKDMKHNAIFVIPPATAEELIQKVGIAPEYEKIDHFGRIIFWSAPLKTFSRTRWSRIVGTPEYKSVTIRNANTARKLAALAGADA